MLCCNKGCALFHIRNYQLDPRPPPPLEKAGSPLENAGPPL